jgi:hypothetical protein
MKTLKRRITLDMGKLRDGNKSNEPIERIKNNSNLSESKFG